MRYFLVVLAVCFLAVVAIAGRRGSFSRRPPIEVFRDMDRQTRLRPQQPGGFFGDGHGSRPPPPGTVARAEPVWTPGGRVLPFEDAPVNTGRVAGKTNFIETNPLPVTATLLGRGRERYTIFCSACHGVQGDGRGVTRKLGMVVVANLHDRRIVSMPDGEVFDVITGGRNLMPAHAAQVRVTDRWAVVAYLRALQLSRLGVPEDLPAGLRERLRGAP